MMHEVFCLACGCRPAGQIPAWGPACTCSFPRTYETKEERDRRLKALEPRLMESLTLAVKTLLRRGHSSYARDLITLAGDQLSRQQTNDLNALFD